MTNDELKTAFRVMDDRLHELDKLTGTVGRFAATAEEVIAWFREVVDASSPGGKLLHKLATCCHESYAAGIPPAGE